MAEFNVIKSVREEVLEEKEETATLEVVETPDRWYSDPVMGDDNRKHVTVHFDGAEFDYCPIVFSDIRVIRYGNKINNATDEGVKMMLNAEILDILIGSDVADSVIDDVAAFHGGIADIIAYQDLLEFLAQISGIVLGEDDLKK